MAHSLASASLHCELGLLIRHALSTSCPKATNVVANFCWVTLITLPLRDSISASYSPGCAFSLFTSGMIRSFLFAYFPSAGCSIPSSDRSSASLSDYFFSKGGIAIFFGGCLLVLAACFLVASSIDCYLDLLLVVLAFGGLSAASYSFRSLFRANMWYFGLYLTFLWGAF